MKSNKTISLDNDIIEKLKDVKSISGLINELLTQYFSGDVDIEREKLEVTLLTKTQESKRINKEVELIEKKLEDMKEVDTSPFNEKEIQFLKDSFNSFRNKNESAQQMRFNAFKKQYRLNYRFEDFKVNIEEMIEEEIKTKEKKLIEVNKNLKEIGEEPIKSINELKSW